MINRDRVHKLATGEAIPERPGDPRGVAAGKTTWHEPVCILEEIVAAPNYAEFERLEPGFNQAYGRLYSFIHQNKRNPWGADGVRSILRDVGLTRAADRLFARFDSNPLFADPAAGPKVQRVARKIERLRQLRLTFADNSPAIFRKS